MIQVYTGDAKGKTTAALGLALRAAGAGLKVFIVQFIKNIHSSELKALERFSDLITIKQYGSGFFKRKKPSQLDIISAQKGLNEAKLAISSGSYDLVVLDEINIAVHYGLIDIEELLAILNSKPPNVEIVLTGRYADKRVIDLADLVTEMREIKHYYKKGVKARKGIEY